MTRYDRVRHERLLATADNVSREEWNRMQDARDKLAAYERKVNAYRQPLKRGGQHV